MSSQELCDKVSAIIADYRRGEIAPPDGAHVARWIDQFPGPVRDPLLVEMAHVLERTYARKAAVTGFLKNLVTSRELVGDDPKAFWAGVRFLRLQQAGNSQRDMLALFDNALSDAVGLKVADCGASGARSFVYLDDAIYSGGRAKSDIIRWIENDAPPQAKVAVIVMAIHTLGEWFANGDIAKATQAAGKTIEVTWWRAMTIEDRKAYIANSDVLRPTAIPAEAAAYVAGLGAPPVLRTGAAIGTLGIFSSGAGRALVEREFLKAGVRVRRMCDLLPQQMRPLGCTWMKTTGFGSMFVTYRNCANNTPLVLWAGNPWYPLFPRRTN
ncbi:MAG: hypothetical protein KGN34_09820 [Sphingomonadales bacterium]|nr:hypothetical protein [Sphingomonadales bacterium]